MLGPLHCLYVNNNCSFNTIQGFFMLESLQDTFKKKNNSYFHFIICLCVHKYCRCCWKSCAYRLPRAVLKPVYQESGRHILEINRSVSYFLITPILKIIQKSSSKGWFPGLWEFQTIGTTQKSPALIPTFEVKKKKRKKKQNPPAVLKSSDLQLNFGDVTSGSWGRVLHITC